MIRVRFQTPDDRDFAVRVLDATLARSEVASAYPRSRTLLIRHVNALFSAPGNIVGIAERDGERVGAILGQTSVLFGTDIPFICDVSFGFPDDGDGAVAAALFRFLQAEARRRGCRSIHMSNVLGIGGAALDRLAEAFGYNAVGKAYRIEL